MQALQGPVNIKAAIRDGGAVFAAASISLQNCHMHLNLD